MGDINLENGDGAYVACLGLSLQMTLAVDDLQVAPRHELLGEFDQLQSEQLRQTLFGPASQPTPAGRRE
jgi:hypothetical protein